MAIKIVFAILLAVFIGSNVTAVLISSVAGRYMRMMNLAESVDDVEGVVKLILKLFLEHDIEDHQLFDSSYWRHSTDYLGYDAHESIDLCESLITRSQRHCKRVLIRLADKTIQACDEILLFMAGWEDGNPNYRKDYLSGKLFTMTRFLDSSKGLLTLADAGYTEELVLASNYDLNVESVPFDLNEILLIEKWTMGVKTMEGWVKKNEDDNYRKFNRLHLYRKAFISATNGLKKVAQKFWAQPD